VSALIGGIGPGQAEALAGIADKAGVPFLNIGASDELPVCTDHVFQVEASAGMYLDAIAVSLALLEKERIFFVASDTAAQEARYQLAAAALSRYHPEGKEAGRAITEPGQALYLNVFDAVRDSGADAVVLLFEPAEQLVFLGQYGLLDLNVRVIGFPDLLAQTRDFHRTVSKEVPSGMADARIAIWDEDLEWAAARELNQSFFGRWGRPMEPSAWTAYAAVELLAQAAGATGSTQADSLADHLAGGAKFGLQKEVAVYFRQQDRQLIQLLYLVEATDSDVFAATRSQTISLAPDDVPGAEGATSTISLQGDGGVRNPCTDP
jgi:ABC-type branched-subunit amino acid transport system substrate-binding protein